jgi:cytochrome oxidase Cu insertion factor (SCO1/SenC/PrrC family)
MISSAERGRTAGPAEVSFAEAFATLSPNARRASADPGSPFSKARAFVSATASWSILLLASIGCSKVDRNGAVAPSATAEPVAREESPLPAPERMPPGAVAAPFTLTERSGKDFDSASLRGKVWLASVFFANCPGPCFRENQAVADILRQIPDPDFMVVSVTCDPDNDTPESLRRYADRFEADPDRWKFLTGDMETIKQIANGTFLLPAEVGVHSERGVVFDREGRLRGSYHLLQPDRVKLLEKLILDVLAEPAGSTPESARLSAPLGASAE